MPEARARDQIDRQLQAAGWILQCRDDLNRTAGRGVAVREFPLPAGEADYLLFVDVRAAGVIEAKKAGTTFSGAVPAPPERTRGGNERLLLSPRAVAAVHGGKACLPAGRHLCDSLRRDQTRRPVRFTFLGQEVRPLVLLDGDDAGRVRRDALMKELYAGHHSAVLMLDDVLGRAGEEVEFEDIFGEDSILPAVSPRASRLA
jgi:hypothetical protein